MHPTCRRMPRLATLAFLFFPSAFAFAFPSAAAAGIQIQSRTSTLNAVRVDPDPALRWNETATATALGEITLSTPHGGTFTSRASANDIGGSFWGSSWRPYFSSSFVESRSSSLEVTFVITGPPADLSLEMWGTSWPPGNAILRITNLAGTVEHFNADWIATNPGSSQSPQEWSSATWTGQLGPGSYRLSASAAGYVTWGPGGGQPWSGSGSFGFGLTIVPAPPAALAFLAVGAMASRRRKE